MMQTCVPACVLTSAAGCASQEQLRSIKKELGLEKDDKSVFIQKCDPSFAPCRPALIPPSVAGSMCISRSQDLSLDTLST